MTEQEIVQMAEANGFEECTCRGAKTFRHRKTSNFLCAALAEGKCNRRGGSDTCNYAERGWTFYKPLPASVKATLAALPCSR